MSIFVALCEGYLGIKPYFELWKYFFYVYVFLKNLKKGEGARASAGQELHHLALPEPHGRIHPCEGDVLQQGVARAVVLPP